MYPKSIALGALLVFASACDTSGPTEPPAPPEPEPTPVNTAPMIDSLQLSQSDVRFIPGEANTVTLTLHARDREGDNLLSRWRASAGRFDESGSTTAFVNAPPYTVRWNPPHQAGRFSVSAAISDGTLEATTSHEFSVIPSLSGVWIGAVDIDSGLLLAAYCMSVDATSRVSQYLYASRSFTTTRGTGYTSGKATTYSYPNVSAQLGPPAANGIDDPIRLEGAISSDGVSIAAELLLEDNDTLDIPLERTASACSFSTLGDALDAL